MLTESKRAAILDAEIQRYVMQGFRVMSRTPSTAQLIRPKTFSVGVAILWAFLLLIGLVIYLLMYAAQSDDAVYLTVNEDGSVARRFSGGAGGGQNDPRRWECEMCGYRNYPSRPRCKRCQVERAVEA